MDEQFPSGAGLLARRAGKLYIGPGRQRKSGDAAPRFRHKWIDIAAHHVARDRLDAASTLVQYNVPPGGLVDISQLTEWHVIPRRATQGERADLRNGVTRSRRKDGRDVEDAVAFVNLTDSVPAVGGAHDIENIDRIETPARDLRLAEPHDDLRHPRRRLQLHIRRV